MGCALEVTIDNGEVTSVSGNTCKRGDIYARKEVTSPTRIVTSTVPVIGGTTPQVPVKTASDIPKDKIFDITTALKDIEVTAPVNIGDIIVSNICDTGVDIIASGNC